MTLRLHLSFVLVLLLACWHIQAQPRMTNVNEPTATSQQIIAFGSCNKTKIDGKMWGAIAENRPDLFIWLGDIIYGDTQDMRLLRSKYKKLAKLPEYKQFAKKTPIIGVWDDHDYGINDGGKYFSKKEESKTELLRFLKVDKNDEIRNRPGAYSSMTIGQPDQLVKIILLDARSFRDTVIHSPIEGRRYQANPDGDILGEAQWQWLEKELTDSDAKVHIIGSGIQFIAEQHGWEKWANFPKARKRLLDLLEKTQPASPLLISGDRHIAEVSALQLEGMSKPLYDFTSSGITHTWKRINTEANKHRKGELIIKRNFGVIRIDWNDQNQPKITLEVRGLDNELFLQQEI